MGDLFERPKVSADCLSAWKISRLALGELTEPERNRAHQHLQRCAHCAALLKTEEEQVKASAYERVPQELLAAKPQDARSWRWKPVGAFAGIALAVLLVMVVPREEESGIRLKGDLPVSFSVMRAGTLVVEESPVETIPDLQPDDQLRLRIHAPAGSWVLLQGLEDTAWAAYYQGSLASDLWLPVGITITPEGDTRLRVVVCNGRPQIEKIEELLRDGTCQQRSLDL